MSSRAVAALLAVLAIAFACRVMGQAIQHWTPQPWLPAFEAFQGSNLPYWLLLSVQIVLLILMTRAVVRVWQGEPPPRWGGAATAMVLSLLYLCGSLVRIAVALAWPAAPAWFSTWIPAIFHVVLASFGCLWSLHACRCFARR